MPEITQDQIDALRSKAAAAGLRIEADADTVHLYEDGARLASVHMMRDGRWIVASYSKAQSCWRSDNIARDARTGMGNAYRFTSGPTLESLADLGIRTYKTPAFALRAWLND